MKLQTGWEEVDKFEVAIRAPDNSVIGGTENPFTVTLRSPRSDKIKNLTARHAEERAAFFESIPKPDRADTPLPNDIAERHSVELVQAAHVAWNNVPEIVEELQDGEQRVVEIDDFESEAFAKFLRENNDYAQQITKAWTNKKNLHRRTQEPAKNS
ncbi:MAG: hypothetical protein AAGC77_06495 [Pseudomonadota bacterium]